MGDNYVTDKRSHARGRDVLNCISEDRQTRFVNVYVCHTHAVHNADTYIIRRSNGGFRQRYKQPSHGCGGAGALLREHGPMRPQQSASQGSA